MVSMSIWTKNPYEPASDAAESLSENPSGGRAKMWLAGVGFALVPAGYGVHCLRTGHAWLPGQYGSGLDTQGSTAVAIAIAYVALGAFMHFHYFWGLHAKLRGVSPLLKLLAVITFLGSLGYAAYQILA